MKRAAAVLALSFASRAHAEPRVLGVDATLSLPLSPWIHATGNGGGGSVWLHIPYSPIVDVTTRVGAIVHADRPIEGVPGARSRLSEIPLFGGARIRVTDGAVRGYLEGEVGLVFRRVDVDVQNISDNSARIRFASSLGAAIEVDRFDLRAAVWLADLGDLDHETGVIISAGASFYRF